MASGTAMNTMGSNKYNCGVGEDADGAVQEGVQQGAQQMKTGKGGGKKGGSRNGVLRR